ncbi:MAG: hypothetical protein AAGF95_20760, partial [Chloroflexota bacterium]
MRQTKQEIEKQLQHKRELITILSARQRPLELQAAQKGINTPPEILTEISTLTDQIRAQEEEIARLESLAAEGQISLAEAEFRVMLAKTWDTLSGRPTIVGDTRLELTRLQLGLTSERATELEYEVRTALAEEIFYKIDISPLLGENTGIPNSIGNTNINIAPEGENTISISNLEVHRDISEGCHRSFRWRRGRFRERRGLIVGRQVPPPPGSACVSQSYHQSSMATCSILSRPPPSHVTHWRRHALAGRSGLFV